jgi:hypothetical protein
LNGRGTPVAVSPDVRPLFLGWIVLALFLFGLGHLTHDGVGFLAAYHHSE